MEYPERIVEFAFCPRPCYQYLADLADPEDWGEDGRVLVNYIDFTYRRAAELMRRQGACGSYIVVDGEAACLDTGLFTSRFEEIWLFGGFCGRDSGIGPAQRAKTTIWN